MAVQPCGADPFCQKFAALSRVLNAVLAPDQFDVEDAVMHFEDRNGGAFRGFLGNILSLLDSSSASLVEQLQDVTEPIEKGYVVSSDPESLSFRDKVCWVKMKFSFQVHLVWLLCRAVAPKFSDLDMNINSFGADGRTSYWCLSGDNRLFSAGLNTDGTLQWDVACSTPADWDTLIGQLRQRLPGSALVTQLDAHLHQQQQQPRRAPAEAAAANGSGAAASASRPAKRPRVSAPRAPQQLVFDTRTANDAAVAVREGRVSSIIDYLASRPRNGRSPSTAAPTISPPTRPAPQITPTPLPMPTLPPSPAVPIVFVVPTHMPAPLAPIPLSVTAASAPAAPAPAAQAAPASTPAPAAPLLTPAAPAAPSALPTSPSVQPNSLMMLAAVLREQEQPQGDAMDTGDGRNPLDIFCAAAVTHGGQATAT